MAAAAVGHRMLLLLPLAAGAAAERAREVLAAATPDSSSATPADDTSGVPWARPDAPVRDAGAPWEVSHVRSASSVCWHHKGDYLASVAPEGASRAVLLHQAPARPRRTPAAHPRGPVAGARPHFAARGGRCPGERAARPSPSPRGASRTSPSTRPSRCCSSPRLKRRRGRAGNVEVEGLYQLETVVDRGGDQGTRTVRSAAQLQGIGQTLVEAAEVVFGVLGSG